MTVEYHNYGVEGDAFVLRSPSAPPSTRPPTLTENYVTSAASAGPSTPRGAVDSKELGTYRYISVWEEPKPDRVLVVPLSYIRPMLGAVATKEELEIAALCDAIGVATDRYADYAGLTSVELLQRVTPDMFATFLPDLQPPQNP